MLLYLVVNVAYLAVLKFPAIQHAANDRVATAMLQADLSRVGRQGSGRC